MNFQLVISRAGEPVEKAWKESYNEPKVLTEEDALAYGNRLLDNYNKTLRPHEYARSLHGVVLNEGDEILKHSWEKQNLTTLNGNKGDTFDIVKCARCGVIARRYGLTRIVRQTPFRTKKFEYCNP